MTVSEMANRALTMLGLGDMEGNTTAARYQVSAVSAVNTVYADLFYKYNTEGYKGLSGNDEINLPERVVNDVMPFGVAAHIAAAIGDTDNQQFFAALYNQKRKTATPNMTVADTLPAAEE